MVSAGGADRRDARRGLRHRCPGAVPWRRSAPPLARRAGSSAHAPPLRLLLSGPGVFSVEARATIKHEVLRLSLISTALIVALLLGVYRSAPTLLLGLLPVVSGALAGVAAVALGFGIVHGITLGFGVTLIGESVDYSIYLFVQSRQAFTPRALWPTLLLGTGTSVCGFSLAAALLVPRSRAARPVLDQRPDRGRLGDALRTARAPTRAPRHGRSRPVRCGRRAAPGVACAYRRSPCSRSRCCVPPC